jgi:alanine racemase
MNPYPRATINLNAIRHNLQLARQCAPHSKIMTVIKADAYGHGMLEIAAALGEVDGLAVARLEEALKLRDAGISQRILLLGNHLSDEDFELCSRQQLDVEVHNLDMAEQLAGLSLATPLAIWLKVDTGMNRMGLAPTDFQQAQQLLQQSNNVKQQLLMTHFSSSDEALKQSCEQQTQLFLETIGNSKAPTSLANSAAIIQHPETHGDWIRPGIMLYGANPLQQPCSLPLQAAMTLTAQVLAIREVTVGDTVGYNGIWKASGTCRIATIGIGYGDGYPRHARNGTPVVIRGQRAKLAGRVSMDMMTVDLSDCEGIEVGDEAILWGKGLPIEEIAECAQTISYALFTSVSARVSKLYIG